MRYNHRYHLVVRGTRRHRRHRIASIAFLGLIAVVLVGVFKTPLDPSQLLVGFLMSLSSVTAAYLISLVLALILGLTAVSSVRVENVLLPILDVAQSFPSFAILPLLVIYFGKTSLSVIAILIIAMIWPIMFSVIAGVKEQRQDQAEAATIFGAKGWKYLAYYRWPMLRPSLLTGSIVSWGQAWDTIVGAEIIAGVMGAGHYLGQLGANGSTSLLLLGIVIYLFLIFAINQLLWLPLLHRYSKYQAES